MNTDRTVKAVILFTNFYINWMIAATANLYFVIFVTFMTKNKHPKPWLKADFTAFMALPDNEVSQ